jgi:phospholipase C
VDRRGFLRGAAALTGGLMVSDGLFGWTRALGTSLPIGGLPLPLPNPNNAPVDNIVVLMMENRSFDHYFGWVTGTNQQKYPDPDAGGVLVDTHHLSADYRGCGHPDPDHGWTGGRAEMANGFLAGRNDEFALGYYQAEDVELYAKLAGNFTLCDNYFAALMGPTYPNREYMHSAQSGGLKTNVLPPQVPGQETGFTWTTIWDRLEAAGVPWGYYFVDLPAIALWGQRLAKGAHHIEDFYADAAAGTLPNVVFVDPGFTTGYRTDEHPHGDMRAGQAFSYNIVKAVLSSPVWPRTAMFLNYDEWGGFFDSVQRPPRMPDALDTVDDPGGIDDFGQLGFRVPCTVMSPYSRQGALASTIAPAGRFYDHTSILKLIEWRFGLEALTVRDAAAANIVELLDFGQAPRLDVDEIVELLPRVPVTSRPCEGDTVSGLPGIPGAPPYPALPVVEQSESDFDAAFASGFFESVGYDLDPRPLSVALGG